MRIIAQDGSANAYIVETRKGFGYIADKDVGERYSEQLIDSLLRFGTWREFTDEQEPLLKELKQLKEVKTT